MEELAGGVFDNLPTLICDGSGQEFVNPRKRWQKPVWLGLFQGDLALTAGGSANGNLIAPRDQGRSGDVELWKLGAESTGRFAVRLYDQAIDKELMNAPVESSLVFGTAPLPSRLYESIFIPNTQALRVEAFDLSGAPNTVSIIGEGVQILAERTPQEIARAQRKRWQHTYWLTFDSGPEITLTALGSQSVILTVPGNVHFEAFGMAARSDGAFDLELVEQTQRSLMYPGGVQDGDLVSGRTGTPIAGIPGASLPNIFATPWLLGPSTQLKATFTDTSNATNKVSLALLGRLLHQAVAAGR